ncbi:hypothetical protein [Homoserinibacter sp. GY 40078]|uniref:hypothetical protein n=1 Tax=Homoserinibacter sp. GY 40078 TaxID=2603275 RepID=UPI0011C94AD1|nr:hypothetical protein [Homoserinibacter sp. GY 40078]TXK18804.1 hypothetical protein FVQ89_02350 [Homoserinibacter sp. GY 40078]
MTEQLTTFAPVVDDIESLHPTGNLLVSLPEIDDAGRCRSISVVSEAERGVVAAIAPAGGGLLVPELRVDGEPLAPEWGWQRVSDWIPTASADVSGLALRLDYLAPDGEQGLLARIAVTNPGAAPRKVELRWSGQWGSTVVQHFRAKELALGLRERDDTWTGARVVYAGEDRLLLAVSWRPGPGAAFDPVQPDHGWSVARDGVLDPGERLELEVYVGVAGEPDGASATALHLRRRGADALHTATRAHLDAAPARTGDAALDARLRSNLFFSHFFAQADTVDTGRTVGLTSRSPRYYVSGAFWSRDAYWWSFPALLLADATRARRFLLSTLAAAGEHVAHHALYVTGTRLYPGFELDQLAAPVLAVWRYVDATGDRSVLTAPEWHALVALLDRELREWTDSRTGLAGTFLLPTDDPVTHPFTATGNALVAVALDIVGRLQQSPPHTARARALRAAVRRAFVHEIDGERRWAWAIDAAGEPEWRDEPPLGLRLLPYLGILDGVDDPERADAASALAATSRWLIGGYPHHYPGPFPGAGAPHFASPSSFDLGNRILTGVDDLGDPLAAFVETPMDGGLACESWDPQTGVVVTGAAMASVAGYLAWTSWAAHVGHRRWDDPFPLGGAR